MNVLKKAVVICMVFLILSVPVYAKKNGGNPHKKIINSRNISRKPKIISHYQENDISTAIEEENVLPITSGLGVTSQIKINNVNVGEAGLRIIDNASMTCNFEISNSSNEQKVVNLLLATYNSDGRLYNINTYSQEVASKETKQLQLVYQFDAESEHSAKIFIWNSLSSMIPIRAEIDFSQASGINVYYYNGDNRLIQVDKANGTTLTFTYDNMGNLLQKNIKE